MPIPYVFRRPRFPVIVVADERAFRALSSAAVQKLLGRELKTAESVRLLDSQWSWFEVMIGSVCAIAPSFVDYQPPTKQDIIRLVNNRGNVAEGSQTYEPRSLANRSREEVFQELLAILPAS